MNRARRPPLRHPLAPLFDRAVDSFCVSLSPDTTRHYRGTVRNFLTSLAADHPEVQGLDQLRREPHILSWMARPDLQREFELARSQPRHLAPQPKAPFAPLRNGFGGVIDSLLAAQYVLEMFRRALPNGTPRRRLDRLSNRLTKILSEVRKLTTP
jgi:hypothetical protein